MPSREAGASAPLFPLLLGKELRGLAAGRSFWVMVLLITPLVGVSFAQAVALYSDASRSAREFPQLAAAMTPLDGVLVPTLGAVYLATTLLFPFVAIRLIASEKESGSLRLILQLPMGPATIVTAKLVALMAGWLLALLPVLSALGLWRILGGHIYWPETLNLLAGHLLYGLIVGAIGFVTAAISEGSATAAIAALAVIIGSWVLDFAASGRGDWLRALSPLSLTAALRVFERGVLSLPLTGGLLAAAIALLTLSAVWLRPGLTVARKLRVTAGVAIVAVVAIALLQSVSVSRDVTEDRRNSFNPADERALRHMAAPLVITAHLTPDDPRLADFERNVLSKVRRLVPRVTIRLAATGRAGLFGAPDDEQYGLIEYAYAGRVERSRSTSPREVLPLVHALAGQAVVPDPVAEYPGYPLVADSRWPAAVWFYGLLPMMFALAWWRSRR